MPTPTPTVFVVDDDESIRRSLRRLFESIDQPVDTFADAEAFLDSYDPERAGCVLVDLRMPGISGLELQERLRARGSTLPVILMSAHADVPVTVRALKAGATDLVEKPFHEQTLLDAVRSAIEEDAGRRRVRAQQAALTARLDRLTQREREVLELVVGGLTNRDIAERWGVSEKTIKVHRGRVMQKMEASSFAQLVLLAQAAGLHTTKVQLD